MVKIYASLIKKNLRKLEDIKDEELRIKVQALLEAEGEIN